MKKISFHIYEDDDYDENKDDDDIYQACCYSDNIWQKLIVNWNKIDSPKFQGYRVVISKNDPNPAYPKNGYLFYITDKNQTSAVIDNSIPYAVNSDFGDYLYKCVKYYISVTAEYSDKFVAGNAVRKTYPGESIKDTHELRCLYFGRKWCSGIKMEQKLTQMTLKYRVVISKNDSTPGLDDGYLYRITDPNKTFAVINNTDKYTGGDFGNYLTKGDKYYFTVVAVYEDEAVAGNAVQFKYDGAENPDLYIVPEVNAYIENGKLVLRWNQINSSKFVGYRVVASKMTLLQAILITDIYMQLAIELKTMQ